MNTTETRLHQRIPFVFPLRLRPYGTTDPWQTGMGIDISVGGVACLVPVFPPPAVGAVYELELVLYYSTGSQERLRIQAEVKWSIGVPEGSRLGLQVSNSSARVALARALLAILVES